MALRYIPLFAVQAKRVRDTQKVLGLYKEDNIADDIRGGARVFNVMVGWALENGIITADSMAARAYGSGRRSSYCRYRLRAADCAPLLLAAACGAAAVCAGISGAAAFSYYPVWGGVSPGFGVFGGVYALAAFAPSAYLLEVRRRWNCLRSSI